MVDRTPWENIQDLGMSYNSDDLGVSYFLANYVVEDSGACPGFLNYTWDVLNDSGGDRELVRAAIRATGLAGIAGRTGADNIMCKARASYAEAIRRVNSALGDPDMIRSDVTIFAVLVLGLFESVSCSNSENIDAWRHHINGAAHLLTLRGTAQFRTKQGLQLFGETLYHVLTLCYRYGHPIPPRLRSLWAEMRRSTIQRSPSPHIGIPHVQVMDLYHRVNPDQDAPFLREDWERLLADAVNLDQRLEDIIAKLPAPWLFKTVIDPTANPRIVYRGVYHIYGNVFMAKVWNGLRTSRIFLNQVIYCLLVREGLAWAPAKLSPDGGAYAGILRRVAETTTEMRDAILASVPQLLGCVHPDTGGQKTHVGNSSAGTAPVAGAYFLVWTLFLAACLPISTAETRAWVVDRLRAIRAVAGIRKATYLADMLETELAVLGTKLPPSEILLPDL